MTKNIEIEFKTVLDQIEYQKLLEAFKLEHNVFKQVNYYFDTKNLDLNSHSIVLRIRQKGEIFKLTLKKQHENEAFEYHVLLRNDQAQNILSEGFHVNQYFEVLEQDYFVTFQTSLENFRASTQYDMGTIFIDKNVYCGRVDYELEYEVHQYKEGLDSFNTFLAKHNLTYKPAPRKSERALACII